MANNRYGLRTRRGEIFDIIQSSIPFDSDAIAYIKAVNNTDNSDLEIGVQYAINEFVVGCKSDGIWNAILASCILGGAKTLDGALTPLKGSAPTNLNFVTGDYNRKNGLTGNGTTKRIDSNMPHTTMAQNNIHLSAFSTTFGNGNIIIGAGSTESGASQIFNGGAGRLQHATTAAIFNPTAPTNGGFRAFSRTISTGFNAIIGNNNYSVGATSAAPFSTDVVVFARGTPASPNNLTSATLFFYSIGDALDLALLEKRVTKLYNDINAAI
jgi:hypothetical protein